MRNFVFFARGRLAEALFKVVGKEQRVVAEAARAALLLEYPAVRPAHAEQHAPVGQVQAHRAFEVRAPVVCVPHALQQQLPVAAVALARKACGVYAGRAAQKVYAQPRIVCQRRLAQPPAYRPRLYQRVFAEGGARLFDLLVEPRFAHGDYARAPEDLFDLANLARVAACRNNFFNFHRSASYR